MLRDLMNSVRGYGEPPKLSDYDFLQPHRSKKARGEPLVSIVTCAYNAADTLPKAMTSVREQTWPHIEYVVVDGGSTDFTPQIIEQNSDIIDVLLSEPDEGLYDAFNRGLAVATGDYIAVLNADDAISPDHVSRSIEALLSQDADFSFGDVEMIHNSDGGERIEHRPADRNFAETLPTGTTDLHHATMLVHRRVIEQIGLFRTKLKIAADYDWFIRMHKAGFSGVYTGVVSRMNYGGVSTERQELSIFEAAFVAYKNGGSVRGILKFWAPILYRRMRWRIIKAVGIG